MVLSDICLAVAYIGPKSSSERPRKTKIGTEVVHVTRDSDTTFKVKRSKVKVTRPLYSPRRLRIRQLQRWQWERIDRENLLLRCGQARSAQRREALRRPQREERGGAYCGGRPHCSLLLGVVPCTAAVVRGWGTWCTCGRWSQYGRRGDWRCVWQWTAYVASCRLNWLPRYRPCILAPRRRLNACNSPPATDNNQQ